MAAAFAREGGYGAPASVIHIDSAHPDHAIIVPDAQLLFTGDFHRAGPDLVIVGHDGRHHIIPGYFASEQRSALAAPNGASLPPNVIDLLAGSPTPNEYAQAGAPAASADPIGTVEKVVGNVTVVRNGVAIALHVGDKVYQSDVIQTGSDSQAGIGFPDGTALNLVANTRMALNEYSYDPNSNSNSALISLVEGTFSFVAGKVAHTGDMKIQTPVATMGIRGTTGWVQELATITANYNNNTYSFAVSPDYGTNQTGIYDLINLQTGEVIATVSQSGFLTLVTPQGVGQSPVVTTQPMTPTQLQFEQQIVQEVFQTLNLINNPNPHSNPGSGGSGGDNQQNGPAQQLLKENGGNLNLNTPGENTGGTGSNQTGTGNGQNLPTPTAYWLYDHDGNWGDALAWSDSWAPLPWQNLIINQPVTVTIDAGDAGSQASGLLVGLDATLQIISGGSLTVTNIVDVFGTIDVNSNLQDPTFTAQGPVTVEALGTIEAIGSAAAVYFSDATGITVTDVNGNATSYTIDNSGTILAGQSGQVFFEQAIINNESAGLIVAQSAGTITFDGGLVSGIQSSLQNSGTVEAIDGGAVVFDLGMLVDNTGTISAGSGAVAGGTVTFDAATLTNEASGLIEAQNGGTLTIQTGTAVGNLGTLEAISGGLLTIHDDVANTGQLLIADGGTMVLVNDTITGGQINLSSAGAVSELQIGGTVTFTGGTVTLSDNAQNAILSNGAAATLINYDGISGAGMIGNGDAFFTLINEPGSIIDATGTNALVIDNDSPATNNFALNEIVNSGTIEATGTGGLTIENTTIDNSTFDPNTNTGVDGHIEAFTGSHIDLDNATILQGFVTVDAGATLGTVSGSSNEIETANGSTHNTAVASISFAGTVSISDDSSLILASPYNIENSGAIELNSTGNQTFLYFAQPAPILSGSGTITLEGGEGSQDIIAGLIGQGYTTVNLDNQNNTISGAGAIGQGDGDLTLQNEALGKIDANISGQTLTIDTGSGVTDTNAGLLEATDGGILALLNTTFNNSGTGAITVDHLATLSLTGIDTITGGGTVTNSGTISAAGTVSIGNETVTNSATGAIIVGATGGAADTLTLTSTTVTNAGSITVDDNALLLLNGGDTVTGAGSITVDSGGMLNLSGADTISGGGTLTVESGGAVAITSGAGVTFDNVVVTDDTTSLTAPGIDVASGAVLTLQGSSSISGSGTGTLAVEAGAQLLIATPSGATLNGIIVDDDGTGSGAGAGGAGIYVSGAVLTLDGGTQIEGGAAAAGTLQIDSAGQLKITGAATLDSVTVTDGNLGGAGIDVSGAVLTLDDETLISGGTLTVESVSGSQLLITAGPGSASDGATAGGATLDAVSVADNATSTATPGIEVASGAVLHLEGDATITGTAGATMTLAGTLESDSGSNAISNLTVTDIGTSGDPSQLTVVSGTLTLSDDTFTFPVGDSSDGVIEITVDSGATLVLSDTHIFDATVSGAVNVPADSSIQTISSNLAASVAAGSTFTLTDENVTGTIDDDGTVLITGGSVIFDNVTVDDDTTATGSSAGIDVSGTELTLEGGTQIQGGGPPDNPTSGTMTVENTAGSELLITSGGATLDGVAMANGGSGIVVSGATLTLDDKTAISGGLLTVANATGSELVVTTGGGTDGATEGGATLSTVQVSNAGSIIVDSGATLTLTGVDSITGGTVKATGATITVGKTLDLASTTLDGGSITNNGLIEITAGSTIDGTTISGNTMSVAAALTLDDATLSGVTVSNSSTITVETALDLTGVDTISGGTVKATGATITVGQTLDLASATLDGGSITNNGLIEITAGSTIDGTTITGGTLDVTSGVTLTLDDDTLTGLTISGGIVALDSAASTVSGATTIENATLQTGTLDVASGVTLTLNDNTLTGLTVSGGTVALDSATSMVTGATTIENATLQTGTLDVASGITLTLNDDALTGLTVSGGIVALDGATSTVSGATTIESGTLQTGTLDVASGQTLTLNDNTLTGLTVSGGTVALDSATSTVSGATTIENAILQTGTLDVASGITLTLNDDTLTGLTVSGGTVALDSATSTVSGATTIENATLQTGTLDVTSGVTLTLDTDTITGVTVSGGTIDLDAATSTVSGNSTIENATLQDGTLTVTSGANLELIGTIDNTATIEVDPAGGGGPPPTTTALEIDGTVTLTGGGTVTLDGSSDQIVAATGGGTLDNYDTISGAGTIGSATLTLDNELSGVIDANVASGTLILDTGSNTITNAGLMEVTNGSTLDIETAVDNTGTVKATSGEIDVTYSGGNDIITASGGTVVISDDSLGSVGGAFGSGAIVSATGGTLTIENGSSFGSGANLSTGGSGAILTVNDSSFGDDASVNATDGSSLTIDSSTFGNSVTIDASGGSSLTVDGGASFTAGDSVTLSSDAVTIDGTGIDGYGTLSGDLGSDVSSITADRGTLDITGLTTGTVAATVDSGDALTVGAASETVTFSTAANAGTIEVAAGTLDVIGAVTDGGTTQIDAGATFQIGSTDAETVTFNGGGTFIIDNASTADGADYTGTIGDGAAGDFASGDTIDLQDVTYAPGTENDVWSQSTDTLTIYSGTTAEASIKLAGSYSQNDFELVGDNGGTSGGTDVVWNPSATTSNAASFSSGSISFENGHWVENDGIVTLGGIDQVTIGSGLTAKTYLLVDNVGAGGYGTIQDAVNAAQGSGDTILIAPGTYQEQVSITNSAASGLTIEGANGAGTVTVDAPTTLEETAISPTSQNPIDGIFTVDGVSNVTITGLALNGLDYGDNSHFAPSQPGTGPEGPSLIGIAYVNAGGGTISSDTITGTDENDGGFGAQRNFGIYVSNTDPLTGDVPTSTVGLDTITISNSILSGFQKGGIVVEYANATISGNTLTGAGDVGTAQNAIQVSGSTGTVSNNIITQIGYDDSGQPAAATGVLAFDNYSLDITGNQFTGALDGSGNVLETPVGVYVLDSTNGEIENNTAANVDDGVVVLSNGFGAGDDILGAWTVTGNTTTNVVPAADGGDSIYFDPDPTTSASTFIATGGAADVGDVFFVSPGSDTLTGGGGGGNSFVVVNASDLSTNPAVDTIAGGGPGNNAILDVDTTSGDTLTIGGNVTDIQNVAIGTFDVNGNFISTDTAAENVNASAYSSALTISLDAGNDTIVGNGSVIDTVAFAATLTPASFSYDSADAQWDVNGGGTLNGTDNVLSGISLVTDGAGDTFLMVGGGSDYTLTSAVAAATTGNTIMVGGSADIAGDTTVGSGIVVDNLGTIEVTSGTLDFAGAVIGTGTFQIDNGVTLEFGGSVDAGATPATGATVLFDGATGTLEIGQSANFAATVSGFASGDIIDVKDVAYTSTETDVWNSSNDTLTITNGTTTATLTFSSAYNQNDFALASDGPGPNAGTDVVWSPAQGSVTGLDNAGNAVEGSAVIASLTGETATSYQWLDDGVAISGATGAIYTPQSTDLGQTLDVVIGFNADGTTEQVTELAGAVTAAASGPTFTWENTSGGDWDTSGDWSSSGYPTASDDAVIGVAGTYTVTVDNNDVAASLSITDATASLDVAFPLVSGRLEVTGAVDNAGTIFVAGRSPTALGSASATFAGSVTNSGDITFGVEGSGGSGGSGGAAGADSGGVPAGADSGGVPAGGEGGGAAPDGGGTRPSLGGDGTFESSVINSGVIEVVAAGNSAVFAGAINNTWGTIEAGDGGLAELNNLTVTGGVLEAAGAGALVELDDATVAGGTIDTAGGGVIETANGSSNVLDGTVNQVVIDAPVAPPGASSDVLLVQAGTQLTLLGTIATVDQIVTGSGGGTYTNVTVTNDGAVALGTTVSSGTIDVGGTLALQGTGTLTLDNGSDLITATSNSSVLDNSSTIAGIGTIHSGSGSLTLINEAGGVIDANVTGETLTIDTGSSAIDNAGTLEATGGGTLVLTSDDIDNAYGANGYIEAFGGSTVQLAADGTVSEGTITIGATGDTTDQLVIGAGDSEALLNLNLNNYGTVQIGSGATLTLEGSAIFGGTVTDNGTNGALDTNGNSAINNAQVDAQVAVTAGTLTLDDVTYSGALTNTGAHAAVHVDAGNTLTLDGGSVSGGAIDLASAAVSEISASQLTGLDNYVPEVSGNGEFIAFVASNGLPGSGGLDGTIELYDSANGQVTDISTYITPYLQPGETISGQPSISADGQYLLIQADYQNNQGSEVFLYNTQSQQVTVLQNDVGAAYISGDGQFAAMEDGGGVLVTDQSGNILTTISGDPNYSSNNPQFGNPGSVYNPGIDNNGELVSFWSTASEIAVTQNGVTTDFFTGNTAETVSQVYVYNRQTNTLQEVSVNNQGQSGNADSGALSLPNGNDTSSSLSANGTYVVFQSAATNLVPGSGAGTEQNGVSTIVNISASNVYLYDTQTHTITLVSAGLNGAAADGASYFPAINADGTYVTFESTADNLVAGGSGGEAQTYVYNIQTGAITLVSATADGTPANAESDGGSSISDDGSIIAYGSLADNLVTPTANTGYANIFVDDLAAAGALDVTANATVSDVTLNGGAVTIASGVTLTVSGDTISGGTISLLGAGAIDVTGATTLENVGLTGGQITIENGVTLTLDDVTVSGVTINAGGGTPIEVDAGQTLVWAGTDTLNDSTIVFDNAGHIFYTGTLTTSSTMQTFDGGGTVTRDGGSVHSTQSTLTLENVDNTFDGYGTQSNGTGSLILINDASGTFDADFHGLTYAIDVGNTITNAGTFEATNGATLELESTVLGDTTVLDNTGNGNVQVAGGGSRVELLNMAIDGGTVGIAAGGTFLVGGALVDDVTFDKVSVTDNGAFTVASGATLTFENSGNSITSASPGIGVITNHGTIVAGTSGAPPSSATFESAVTNSGEIGAGSDGSITIASAVTNSGQIGAGSGGSITIGTDVTDSGQITNQSSGFIGALTGGQVTIQHSQVDNYGQLGPNGGTFTIDHSTIDNYGQAGGSPIEGIAADSSGIVTVEYSKVVNSGAVTAQDDASITFEYSHVVNTAGTNADANGISAYDGGSITFEHSTIDNTGEIRATTGSSGTAGTISIDDSTVTGGGTITVAAGTLNLAGGTIDGGTITNNGTIDVAGPGATLDGVTVVDDGALTVGAGATLSIADTVTLEGTGTVTDDGVIMVTSGATLIVDQSVNLAGTIEANGGTVQINTDAADGPGTIKITDGGTVDFTDTSPSQDVTFAGAGTLELADSLAYSTNYVPGNNTGAVSGFGLGDKIDLQDIGYSSSETAIWSQSSGTLTLANSGGTLETLHLDGSYTQANFSLAQDNGTSNGTDVVFNPVARPAISLWGASSYPSPAATDERFLPLSAAINGGLGEGLLYYGEAANFNQTGVNTVNESALTVDPFLLPYQDGATTTVASSLSLTSPFKYNDFLVNQNEGVAFYETETAPGTINQAGTIVQVTLTDSNGPGNPLTVGTPSAIESNLSGVIESLFTPAVITSGALTSYAVAWDQYDSSAKTYQAYFQTFNAGGGAAGSPVQISDLTDVTTLSAAATWFFSSNTSFTSDGALVPYALIAAQSNGTVQFQGYNSDGTEAANVNWTLTPNLTDYEPGATSQVTVPLNPATGGSAGLAVQFVQAGTQFVAAWNETVTDGAGTHDQVEFAIFKPNELNAGGTAVAGTLVSQTAIQIADGDAQDIRVGSFGFDGSTYEYLVYGDTTATHIVEFDSSGNEIASITDPITFTATLPYTQAENFGDGRVGITYSEPIGSGGTENQYVTQIYDLRPTGVTINDSLLSDGLAKYVAGTQFNDTFTGESNVSNTYYYVGSASGSAPTDNFTGGGDTAWNVAILPDALSNYHISTSGETTTLTNIGDPQHAGTLNLTSVQEVVFDPSVDPSGNSGLLEAFAGSTVLLLGPLSNVSEPAQIDSGATLAIDTPASGTVTFAAGATGTLILAQPSAFTGSIASLAAGDVIDLIGTQATSATISGSTLTVFDDGTAVKTLNISGAQSGDVVVVGGDGNTGNPGSDLMIEPAAYVWDDIAFPAVTGTHLYGPFLSANTGFGVIGVGFNVTTSGYTDAGPDVINAEVKTLDPFLLPDSGGAGTVSVGTSATFPTSADDQFPRQSLFIASLPSGGFEGIDIYETPDGSGALAIDADILAEGSGPNSPLVPSANPIVLESGGITGKGFSASTDNNSNGQLASYGVSWDNFNSNTGAFSVDAQVFNGSTNAAESAVTTLLSPGTTFAGGYQTTPAWTFRSAGTSGSSDPYGLAYSTGNGTTSAGIEFQAYSLPSSSASALVAGTSFFIGANLTNSAFGAGATDQILEETNPASHTGVGQALQYTSIPSSTNLAFAWNDTVTTTGGANYDQVEFAITTPSGTINTQTEFQVADGEAQNIRLASYSYSGTTYVVLGYGDSNGTNLVEFNATTGAEVASYFDPSTATFNQLTALGDGRVVVTYDEAVGSGDTTTQFVTDVIDFRTSGLTPSSAPIANGATDDFAGTRFDDVVQGVSGKNNTYYYVGDNTTIGTGPTDSFTGSTSAGAWNVAIMPDAPSNYSVNTTGGVTTLINTGDPAHAGTLNLTDVQAVAFAPTVDPSGNSGTLTATGDGLFILGPLPGGSEPITIDNGSSLALGTPEAGTVTFAGSAGTLFLTSPTADPFTGQIAGLTAGDVIDLGGVQVQSATISGATLTVAEANGGTLTYTVAGSLTGDDFVVHSDGSDGSDLVLSPAGYLWGSSTYPSPAVAGEHLFFPGEAFNEGLGVDALLYGETSDYQPTGTNSVTENVIGFDPFLLPIGSDTPVALTDPPLSLTVPVKYQLTLANLGPGQGEGIAVYVTEGTTDTIVQAFITGGVNGGNPLAVGMSTAIESNLSGTIENLYVGSWDPSGVLSTFDVAWDQYDSTNGTYQAYFQIFAASGMGLGTPTEIYNLTGGVTFLSEAPAWFFGGTAPISSGGTSVPYALATAQPNGDLQYQGYLADGMQDASVYWTLTPNLSAYEPLATSQITQEVQENGTSSGSAVQLAAANGQIVAGWNETVTDGAGTHDQVEFAIFDPNTLDTSGSLVSQTAIQITDGDAQNIRVGSFVLNGSTFEYLVYGDTTATHIVEFDASGNEIASITDPINFTTTLPYSQIENFGDGRIGITYNEPVGTDGTTQYVTNIYDLRTTGLDETLSGSNNYAAGTQFNDTVTGASGSGVENFYAYVGQNASGQGASDTGATDVFNGGNDSWNVAILAGTRADYSVESNGGNGYVITYIDPDQAHAGSLTVNQNVEALAFNPAIEPSSPGDNSGMIEASGDTLMVLTQFAQNANIDAGSTLEFAQVAGSGTVTFDGSTGTLRLDDAPAFGDAIADFTGNGTLAGSDHIDLADINLNSSQFGAVYNSTDDTLTVTDGTNTADLYFSTGSFTQANFAFTTDGDGGTLVYDPPTSAGEPSVLSAATADGASGTVSFADSDTTSAISASVTPDGSNYAGNFTLDAPTESNGIVSVGFAFNDGQVNLASGETLTQSYNVAVADVQNPAADQTQTVSVTIGGPGNDNFVFAPGIGADTITNFNVQQDTLEFDHFASVQTAQELQALISTDAHGDAVINLGHNDSVTLAGVTDAQLQHIIQAGHVLLH